MRRVHAKVEANLVRGRICTDAGQAGDGGEALKPGGGKALGRSVQAGTGAVRARRPRARERYPGRLARGCLGEAGSNGPGRTGDGERVHVNKIWVPGRV